MEKTTLHEGESNAADPLTESAEPALDAGPGATVTESKQKNGPTGGGTPKGKQQQQQKPIANRKRRKRVPKDVNAPKHPLTGYVRYINEHRESVRQKNPSLTAVEITKLIAEEWSNLSEEKKKPFLDAAEADKERYNKEITEYKLNNEAKRAKACAEEDFKEVVPYVNGKVEKKEIRTGDYDIPIFTEDFLEHNKMIDSQLRMLRKSNIDYEQQNSVLEKHVENMANGVRKLDNETGTLNAQNAILHGSLQKLQSILANALHALPIGSEISGATVDNIEKYMAELHQMANSSSQGHTLNKAKDIVRKLDLLNFAV